MLNNQNYGSKPIKNEQSGSKISPYREQVSIVNNEGIIEIFIRQDVIKELINKSLDRHPLSPEDIERAAKEYAENENSAYTNDYYGFIAGANFAKQPLENESIRDLLRWLKDNHFLNETEDTLNYIVNNYHPHKK